jgi:hypothetical protein
MTRFSPRRCTLNRQPGNTWLHRRPDCLLAVPLPPPGPENAVQALSVNDWLLRAAQITMSP